MKAGWTVRADRECKQKNGWKAEYGTIFGLEFRDPNRISSLKLMTATQSLPSESAHDVKARLPQRLGTRFFMNVDLGKADNQGALPRG
jgi:hypothetical protein